MLKEMPFYNLVDYDIELIFESQKQRIRKLMNDHRLTDFIKEQALSDVLNIDHYTSCEYYDDEKFMKVSSDKEPKLNIFSLNISSLPKHGGELVYFLNSLQTEFQVMILCEIGSKNLSTVEYIFPNHNFLFVPPNTSTKGGVGIYI